VHTGGSIDDEHGGWATLFKKVNESLTHNHNEHAVAKDALDSLPERYQQRLAHLDPTHFLHLREARVFASNGTALPGSGMHWRGRLSAVSGWSFGLLEPTPPVGTIDNPGHHG
jgi:hypothetical protein